MNVILTAVNGALQYHRGKKTGLSGLFFIGMVLVIAFQWDHILPVLEKIGLIALLDKFGLVYEGESYLTGYAVFMVTMRLCLLLLVIAALLIVIGIIVSIFFSSKAGLAIALGVVTMVIAPFFTVWALFDHYRTPKHVRKRNKTKSSPMPKTTVDIIKESSEELNEEKAKSILNRIPTYGDDRFLIGVTQSDEVYVLLPRPDVEDATYMVGDIAGVLTEVKNNSEILSISPMKRKKDDYNESYILPVPLNKIVNFYVTKNPYFNEEFVKVKNQSFYKEYVEEMQKYYFKRKETLTSLLMNELDSEKFNRISESLGQHNAYNEDVVRLMLESEEKLIK